VSAAHRKLKPIILERDDYTCHWCGEPATTLDHIQAVSRGGTDHPDNLVAACAECNASRNADG
jgi:5-methylcytosine-specific restriction endonuclease McrA